jgi:hypothetical protein
MRSGSGLLSLRVILSTPERAPLTFGGSFIGSDYPDYQKHVHVVLA